MKIETFEKLLKTENSQATAYVPEKVGKRQAMVNVVFTPNGKVYSYKGTILQVAEKLELIPEINVDTESKKAIASLKETGSAVTPIECFDTINYNYNVPGKVLQEVNRSKDEFNREIVTVEMGTSEWI